MARDVLELTMPAFRPTWTGDVSIDSALMDGTVNGRLRSIENLNPNGISMSVGSLNDLTSEVESNATAFTFKHVNAGTFVLAGPAHSSVVSGDSDDASGRYAWVPGNLSDFNNWWWTVAFDEENLDFTITIDDGLSIAAPTNFAVSNPTTSGDTQLSVSWTAVTGVRTTNGYEVEYSTASDFTGSSTVQFSTNSGTITGLSSGTEYYLRVRAYDGDDVEGDWTASVTETTYFAALTQVTGVTLRGLDENRISVSWTAVTNAATYTVEHATMSDFSNATSASVATNSTTITGLTADTTYYVRVRAVNDEAVNDMGAWSASANVDTLISPAAVPEIPALSDITDTSMLVRWKPATNATGYKVQYSTESDFSSLEVVEVAGANTDRTTLTGLDDNTAYYVRVVSVRTGAADSAPGPSITRTTLISAPVQVTGVRSTETLSTQIALAWTGIDTATSYEVEWSENVDFTSSTTQSVTNAAYTITGLTKLVTYNIRVRALRTGAVAAGAWSATLTLNTLDDPPARVTGVTVSSGATEWDRATVAWTAVTDATVYTVEWASSTDFSTDKIGMFSVGSDLTSYVVMGLDVFTNYVYRVRALKTNSIPGAWSLSVRATTGRYPAPATPTNLTLASPMYSQINTSWNAVADATSYQVVWDTASTFSGSSSSAVANGTSYSITGLSENTLYYVGVAAQRTNAVSDSTRVTDSIMTPIRSAAVAAGVTLTATSPTSIRVNWTTSARATGYIVQWRGPGQSYDSARQATVGAVTQHDITGLSDNTTYRVQVIAIRTSAPNANPSTEVSRTTLIAAPGAVGNFRSTAQTETSITMGWARATNATGYHLEWGTTAARVATNRINIGSGGTRSRTVTGLTFNTPYYFRIRAIRTGAVSDGPWSSVLTVNTAALQPAAEVTGLRKVSASNNSVRVAWNQAARATGYTVQWSYFRNFEGSWEADVTGGDTLTYEITQNVVPDRTLFVRVIALRTGAANADSSNILAAPIPDVERIAEELRLPKFPVDNFSSMPVLQVGARMEVSVTDNVGTLDLTGAANIYVYLLPRSSGYTGLNNIVNTGTVVTIDGYTISTGTSITVGGTSVSADLTGIESSSIIVAMEHVSGNTYQFKVYNGETGILLDGSGDETVTLGNATVVVSDSLSKIIVEKTSGRHCVWYSNIPEVFYESASVVPLSARVIRGRDGQRQLVPPRVPGMVCTVWDEDGQVYKDRPYIAGTEVVLLAMLPGGLHRIMFTGLVDKVKYNYKGDVFTYGLSCLGLSSQLVTNEVYGEVLSKTTVGAAITATLDASGWEAGVDYELDESTFSAALSYWWLDGSSAWQTLNRLITTEGPPAIYYENAEGKLIFQGTGGNRSDRATIPIYTFGSGSNNFSIINSINEESEAKDLVNHAGMRVTEYEEEDEASVVWSRGTQFIVSPGEVHELIASFPGSPLLEYSNINEPDFESTSTTLEVSYKEDSRNATRAIIVFDNTSGTQLARVRNVEIQGRHLEVKSVTDVFSDRINGVVEAVQDSIDTYGTREWSGDPYDTVNLSYARHLVEIIPQNFHEGLEVFSFIVYANNKSNLLRMHLFQDEAGARLSGTDYTDVTKFGQPFIRRFEHKWTGGLYTVNMVVEARSLDFYGVDPFLIGSNADSGRGYS